MAESVDLEDGKGGLIMVESRVFEKKNWKSRIELMFKFIIWRNFMEKGVWVYVCWEFSWIIL